MALSPEDAAKLQISRYEQWHGIANLRLAYVSDLSSLVQKQMLLLNGGGIVAMFTLLGHSDLIRVAGNNIWAAFSCFGLSFVFMFTSIGCSFFAQNYLMVSEWNLSENIYMELVAEQLPQGWKMHDIAKPTKLGSSMRVGAIVTALLSAAFFVAAGGCALFGVQVRDAAGAPASCASTVPAKSAIPVKTTPPARAH